MTQSHFTRPSWRYQQRHSEWLCDLFDAIAAIASVALETSLNIGSSRSVTTAGARQKSVTFDRKSGVTLALRVEALVIQRRHDDAKSQRELS